jgi:nucleotide-binding universal stress UspA family protein
MTAAQENAGNDSNIQLKKILVPIDGSEFSLKAVKYAAKIAQDENAQIICIHVIVGIPYGYSLPEYHQDIKEKVESWFVKVKDIAKTSGVTEVKTEIFMDVNSVVGSIIDVAKKETIDLIVIGTKGRTGLKRFLTGSVANGVLQHAHCPVLLVR